MQVVLLRFQYPRRGGTAAKADTNSLGIKRGRGKQKGLRRPTSFEPRSSQKPRERYREHFSQLTLIIGNGNPPSLLLMGRRPFFVPQFGFGRINDGLLMDEWRRCSPPSSSIASEKSSPWLENREGEKFVFWVLHFAQLAFSCHHLIALSFHIVITRLRAPIFHYLALNFTFTSRNHTSATQNSPVHGQTIPTRSEPFRTHFYYVVVPCSVCCDFFYQADLFLRISLATPASARLARLPLNANATYGAKFRSPNSPAHPAGFKWFNSAKHGRASQQPFCHRLCDFRDYRITRCGRTLLFHFATRSRRLRWQAKSGKQKTRHTNETGHGFTHPQWASCWWWCGAWRRQSSTPCFMT